MPYVTTDGRMVQSKPFGIGLVMDYFWGAVSMVQLFFRGLFHMDDPQAQRGQYGNNHRVPGRRGMGGVRSTGGVAAPPCVGGG